MSKRDRRKQRKQRRRQEKINKARAARRQEARKSRKQDQEIKKRLDAVGDPEKAQIGPVEPFELKSQDDSPPYLSHNEKMLESQEDES